MPRGGLSKHPPLLPLPLLLLLLPLPPDPPRVVVGPQGRHVRAFRAGPFPGPAGILEDVPRPPARLGPLRPAKGRVLLSEAVPGRVDAGGGVAELGAVVVERVPAGGVGPPPQRVASLLSSVVSHSRVVVGKAVGRVGGEAPSSSSSDAGRSLEPREVAGAPAGRRRDREGVPLHRRAVRYNSLLSLSHRSFDVVSPAPISPIASILRRYKSRKRGGCHSLLVGLSPRRYDGTVRTQHRLLSGRPDASTFLSYDEFRGW